MLHGREKGLCDNNFLDIGRAFVDAQRPDFTSSLSIQPSCAFALTENCDIDIGVAITGWYPPQHAFFGDESVDDSCHVAI